MSDLDSLWPGTPPLSAAEHAALLAKLEPAFAAKLQALHIDRALLAPALNRVYLPLAAWLVRRKGDKPLVLGINGGQGSGKSTLCEFLKLILQDGFGLRVAGLSIDDIYKTRAEREQLARTVHPLLLTRGVPGTHDVALGLGVIGALKIAGDGDSVSIPSFDKARDDRRPLNEWPHFQGKADIIIFEGWCVGAKPQDEGELARALNSLEAEEDADGRWRRYVNEQLKGAYAELFGQLDALVMLKVPSMERVFEWRSLQEEKLADSLAYDQQAACRIMDAAAIRRFVQHYERITRAMLEEMPKRADVTLFVDDEHQICRIQLKETQQRRNPKVKPL